MKSPFVSRYIKKYTYMYIILYNISTKGEFIFKLYTKIYSEGMKSHFISCGQLKEIP